ncbi:MULTISPECIES: sulfatase-like hydrolase/transferase [unclassified Pseudonocardia]|uniref:sulfatase family protein n=1 Tax=unclassified Pseudonocardia TaxID=2619320 RepID=UPI0001FFF007|nr:sulfatase-like hydrolase/transferase [Pseudonocardia sp. Ae707_Ps1]OLM18974.1 Choline-sulfatase [Pseudonocardia sp. Ae707_Ps1]
MAGPPNIVFVITDQQRFDTVGALGHEHARTPTLDRLVAEGTAFTRTYVTAPSCAPSRASLFMGMYPHSTGVLRNEDPWHHSWVEQLADAGYRCVNVGKMHTYPYETSAGFHERHVVENKDRFPLTNPHYLDQWDKAFWTRGVTKPGRGVYRERPDYQERMGAFVWEAPDDLHSDTFVGGLAEMWLDRWTGDGPFFLQVGFPGPHPPYDPTAEALERYDGVPMPPAVRTADDLAAQPAALQELRRHNEETDHDSVVHLADPDDEQIDRQRRHYMANVSMIDDQVAGIVEALRRRGVLDDTVIVFASDHGDCLNDHGHIQKWTMYEPSVRVPLIVWGPGRVAADRRIDGLTSLMDVGPTVLELAGVEPPEWMEARSLLPALHGEEWPGREHAFSEHARDKVLTGTALMTMVRDDRYKLVELVDDDRGQLFDLERDPQEEHDLWYDPAYDEVRRELLGVISRWRAQSALTTAPWKAAFR